MIIEQMLDCGEEILWEHSQDEKTEMPRKKVIKWLLIFFVVEMLATAFFGFAGFFVNFMMFPLFAFLLAIRQDRKTKRVRYALTNKGLYIQDDMKNRTLFFDYQDVKDITLYYEYLDGNGNTIPPAIYQNGGGSIPSAIRPVISISYVYRDSADKMLEDVCVLHDVDNREEVLRLVQEQKKTIKKQEAKKYEMQAQLQQETKESLLASLSNETVSDLQAELFGMNAEQQGAFPDPTVNPLPALPEQDNDGLDGQFMQGGF